MYNYDYLTLKITERLENIKEAFNKHYPTNVKQKFYLNKFLPDFIYNTNAIDGNSLSAKDTFNIINRKIPKSKKHSEILEAENMRDCFFFTLRQDNPTKSILKQMHEIILKDIDGHAGSFRDHDVEIYGSKHLPCDYLLVENELDKLLEWYDEVKNGKHPFELAAIFHRRFAAIHPFFDANGRIARLLTNYILWQHKYPLFVFKHRHKKIYFQILEECNINHLEEPFVNWFVEEYIKQNGKI
ncbi:Fic family protein [Candidatus Woesearchaeota archaeon]|nr:Fic family protein [Candidatus Woesearchaeota archaeon]